jgi:hypothetical protein
MRPAVQALIFTLCLSSASAVAQVYPAHILMKELPAGSPITTDSEDSRDIAFADFDGQNGLDVLVANLNEDNSLYLNNGDGTFARYVSGSDPLINDGGNSRGLAVTDLEPDGDMDVFVCNSSMQANFLYTNNGDGTFTKVVAGAVATDIANSRHATFFDANGDRAPDLFVANFNGQDNALYLNRADGSGLLDKVTDPLNDAVHDGGVSYDCAVADIDGDNVRDLFVSNHDGVLGGPGSANYLYLNDGDGRFTRVLRGAIATDIAKSLGCAFGDFDNDGDPDLYVANDELSKNNLYRNDGGGTFTPVLRGPLVEEALDSINCEWFDIDGRNGVDLFVANRNQGMNQLFMNNGRGGGFGLARQPFGPLVSDGGDSYGFAFGNLDLDPRPDVGVANLGRRNTYYRNDGPQWQNLGNQTEGMLGRPTLNGSGTLLPDSLVGVKVDRGPESGLALVIVGFSAVFQPFKGGVLVPDPLPPSRIVLLPLDIFGRGEVSGRMPLAFPSGLSLIIQAWMPDPIAILGWSASNALSMITP